MKALDETSPRVEEYLESIFKLQQIQHPVSTGRLAEHLKLSPPSVSEMIKKLAKSGLVHYTEKGVCLTKKGEKIATGVVRRHRLSERLLTDLLGFRWDEVHEEACRLEHAITPEIEEKIAKSLGNPKTCPHGFPIPSEDGTFEKVDIKPLSNLGPSESGIIVSVFEEDPEMLRYLATLGLIPEVTIRVLEVAPFGGPLIVCVGNSKYALGREIASKITV